MMTNNEPKHFKEII